MQYWNCESGTRHKSFKNIKMGRLENKSFRNSVKFLLKSFIILCSSRKLLKRAFHEFLFGKKM